MYEYMYSTVVGTPDAPEQSGQGCPEAGNYLTTVYLKSSIVFSIDARR